MYVSVVFLMLYLHSAVGLIYVREQGSIRTICYCYYIWYFYHYYYIWYSCHYRQG